MREIDLGLVLAKEGWGCKLRNYSFVSDSSYIQRSRTLFLVNKQDYIKENTDSTVNFQQYPNIIILYTLACKLSSLSTSPAL